MMARVDSNMLRPEIEGLAEEVRRIFDELDRARSGSPPAHLGAWTPSIDVIETADTVEVLVDVAGVSADSLRLMVKSGTLAIVGEKRPAAACHADASAFHLVERAFGRFARAVRLADAYDAARITARLRLGELRVTIPKILERRGREIPIPIQQGE